MVQQNLKNLRSLDLYSCEVSTAKDYRDNVFEMLPQLRYLDGFDQEDNEVPNLDSDGKWHGAAASASPLWRQEVMTTSSKRNISSSSSSIR